MVERLSSELRDMDARSIILQGAGEPLLHPDIADIIAMFKNAGFAVQLHTNGILLNAANAQKLIASGLDMLRVSLWGITPEEYESQYPGTSPANLERVIENLRLFARIKNEGQRTTPRLLVYYPINAVNYRSIDCLVNLAQSTGCDGVHLAPWSIARGAVDQFSLSLDQARDVVLALHRTKGRLESRSLHHNIDQVLLRYRAGKEFWQSYPCYITWFHARIRVDGDVQPCGRCELSLGNLQEAPFHQLWNGPAMRAFRRQARTRDGISALSERCDCHYCCYAMENVRVHRLFRWFSPFVHLNHRETS
jgi:MoaA/NifB/PqqE/SkfB family radical SAM enzyme